MSHNQTAKLWHINEIQAAVRAAGSHWFDPDTMRFFRTRVLSDVIQGPGGIYFITTDARGPGARYGRGATVRQFTPPNDIKTIGEVGQYRKADAARQAARQLAAAKPKGFGRLVEPEAGGIPYAAYGVKETAERFRPVTVEEQFLHDLDAHSTARDKVTLRDARHLITSARRHHRLMEQLCNGEIQYDAEGENAQVNGNRALILAVARRLGVQAVRFSGDPRGCTVKLIFADGFKNDFANEGYCVPIDGDQADDEPADE